MGYTGLPKQTQSEKQKKKEPQTLKSASALWDTKWLWFNGHSLSKLWESVEDKEASCVVVHEAEKNQTQFSNWITTTI